jgi:tight adherence protein C
LSVPTVVGLTAAAASLAASAGWAGARTLPPLPLGRAAQTAAEPAVPRTSRRDRRARSRALHAEVPQLLDLLAAGSTAGLSAEASFRQAVECLHGPLGAELGTVMRAVDLGVPWRGALADHVARSADPDLARTVAVLARTEALGVPLRDATRELAATVRDARRAETLERARTAPVKMLFPLVFLILPAFLLLTVVPVLITTVRSID